MAEPALGRLFTRGQSPALVARAVAQRQTRRARSGAEIRHAATEGWIHVPKKTSTLSALLTA